MTESANKVMKLMTTMLAVLVLVGIGVLTAPAGAAGGAPDGNSTFRSKCASCHAVDGSGNTAIGRRMKIRDLRSPEVQQQSDAQLYSIISKGKGKMPGYEKSLGADSCKQLVAHIRKLAR